MNHKKLLIFLFAFLISIFLLDVAYAIDDSDVVDISQVPQRIADALNVPLFAGQVLASAIIFSLLCLPSFILTKNSIAHISAIIISLSLCLALGWMPYWILLLLSLLIAFIYSSQIKKAFAG